MFRTILLGLAVGLLLDPSVVAQIPPRYEIVTIDGDPTYNYTARMNNHGQIVYSTWFDDGNVDGIDIFLYDNGETIRLTDDNVYDRTPDINDDGTIVWSRAVDGPGTPIQIVLWQDGELTQLTFSEFDDIAPRINSLGHVTWTRWKDGGCAGASADAYFYDGQMIHQITDNSDLTDQYVVLNDHDDIVWTEYDFCQDPWTSRILMYADGVVTQLTEPDADSPRAPTINNLGQVAWTFQSGWGEHGIQLWEDGAVTTLTEWGGGAKINNRGEVAFYRWYDAGPPIGAYEVWLYRNGRFYQITDDPHDQGWNNIWNLPGDLNDRGEISYRSGRSWYYEMVVKCMKLRLGGNGSNRKIEPISVRPVNP